VLDPLPIEITNFPENTVEWITIENSAENPELGSRDLPFSRHLIVEREDFMEVPEKGFRRLFPGNEVRFKGAYFIKCNDVVKDENGKVVKLLCTYDPETKSGNSFTGRKVKATLHWLDVNHTLPAQINLYSHLLKDENITGDEVDWPNIVDPDSLIRWDNAQVEESINSSKPEDKYQFIRHGYFVVDMHWKPGDKFVFNRIVALKETKKKKKG